MGNLQKAYEKVFNSDGSIKVCGREACSELINLCSSLEPTICFGEAKTGLMNITNIQTYYRQYSNN